MLFSSDFRDKFALNCIILPELYMEILYWITTIPSLHMNKACTFAYKKSVRMIYNTLTLLSRKRDSNPRPIHYEWIALPTEPFRHSYYATGSILPCLRTQRYTIPSKLPNDSTFLSEEYWTFRGIFLILHTYPSSLCAISVPFSSILIRVDLKILILIPFYYKMCISCSKGPRSIDIEVIELFYNSILQVKYWHNISLCNT